MQYKAYTSTDTQPNTPGACPAKLSKHQRTYNQLEEYQLWSWLPEFRRYLCTTSNMYSNWRCNCYLHTTSDQNDTVSSCQPIQAFWKRQYLHRLIHHCCCWCKKSCRKAQNGQEISGQHDLYGKNGASLWLFLCNNFAPLNDEKSTCEWFCIDQSSQPSLASNKPWRSIEDVVAMFQFSES